MPAYEDTWYYLWRERRLPTNVDPFDSRLADPLERERLRRVFDKGLDSVVGHVLPLNKRWAGAPWHSGPWFLREERCYLVPGDSPLGYRLPLDSQPWASAGDYPWIHEPDPTQLYPPLPAYRVLRQPHAGETGSDLEASPRQGAARPGARGARAPHGWRNPH